MPHPYSRYRLRFLTDILRIFIAPSACFSLLLAATRTHLGLFTLPCHVILIVLTACVRNWYCDYEDRRAASEINARVVPVVQGKWPGNLDILIKFKCATASEYLGDFFLSLFEEHQSTIVNLRMLGANLYITMDEEHIKYMMATGFERFWRGRRQKERMELYLGDGIFNRDDDQWKMHRAMARPFFARDRISDFELFERYTERTLSIITSRSVNHTPLDVQDLFARFTLDAASEALFGQKLDTLCGTLPHPGQIRGLSGKGSAPIDEFGSFAQAFEVCQEIIVERTRRGYFWPAFQLFKDDIKPYARTIDEYLKPMITRVLENKQHMRKAGLTSTLEHSTFLEYLADNTDDPKIIRDQLLNILLASRDTTSSLLTFVIYFLALHPDAAHRLRSEILDQVGPDRPPTFDDIKNMYYLRAVIKETLRLFPPVPQNQRECRDEPAIFPKSDRTYPHNASQPIYVPPNTNLLYTTILTHRNKALWGPDADVFDPNRWLDERKEIYTENPMMYTPFSAGPRICLGQNYALNQASYFLVRLLQRFDMFTLAPDCQPEGSLPPEEWKFGKGRTAIEKLRPCFAMTLYVKGGLWVRFVPAQQST